MILKAYLLLLRRGLLFYHGLLQHGLLVRRASELLWRELLRHGLLLVHRVPGLLYHDLLQRGLLGPAAQPCCVTVAVAHASENNFTGYLT